MQYFFFPPKKIQDKQIVLVCNSLVFFIHLVFFLFYFFLQVLQA